MVDSIIDATALQPKEIVHYRNDVYDWRLPARAFMVANMRYNDPNHPFPPGSTAVIFCAQRSQGGDAQYHRAANAMEKLAMSQNGYLAMHHARGDDGFGITVSYWRDEAAAIGWRDNAQHKEMRDEGRAQHYKHYTITIAKVTRGYSWEDGKL